MDVVGSQRAGTRMREVVWRELNRCCRDECNTGFVVKYQCVSQRIVENTLLSNLYFIGLAI